MVQSVLARDLADRVLVVPAYRSPHKKQPLASAHHRLNMARLALSDLPEVEVLDLEVVRGGISYTVETVAELVTRWPDDTLRLIVGADTLSAFHLWRRPDDLLDMVEPIVLARGDWQGDLPPLLAGRTHVISDFRMPVSASVVRDELAAGRWPRHLVPHPVLAYIAEHHLYTSLPPAAGEAPE
jgi:nicotinate-nucleotide adenylyltransferase